MANELDDTYVYQQAQCPPDPRTPSLPHTFTTLPPPTHRPTPPRRRLTAPIPPDSATGPALALPSLRRPRSTTAAFPRASSPRSTMGAPHHGCPPPTPFPALHAARPLSQWAHADRSRDRPCPHTSLLCPPCVRRLSLLRGDSHYMGTQSGASPRPFVVSVVHTMNTMAGAMQFSRG